MILFARELKPTDLIVRAWLIKRDGTSLATGCVYSVFHHLWPRDLRLTV